MEHPKNFPYVRLDDRANLPKIAGVYFALQGEDVLYVGQSYNIRQRWERHHKTAQLEDIGGITIHYIKSDGRSLFQQEAEWMNFCRPLLNLAGPRYYPQPVFEDLREIPPNLTYYVYIFTAMPAFLFAMINLMVRDEEKFMIGAVVFLCSTAFYIGGWFTWWVARKVYKAKTTIDWSNQ